MSHALTSFLSTTHPGSVAYEKIVQPPNRSPEIAFFIRESKERLTLIPANPLVQAQTAILHEGSVMPLLFLLKLGVKPPLRYESWFNYHGRNGQIPQYLEILRLQKRINLLFFTDTPVIDLAAHQRCIEISNPFETLFSNSRSLLRASAPWSNQQFNEAKRTLEDRFSTDEALWKAVEVAWQHDLPPPFTL